MELFGTEWQGKNWQEWSGRVRSGTAGEEGYGGAEIGREGNGRIGVERIASESRGVAVMGTERHGLAGMDRMGCDRIVGESWGG